MTFQTLSSIFGLCLRQPLSKVFVLVSKIQSGWTQSKISECGVNKTTWPLGLFLLHAFWKACEPILAICLSITDVNSSITICLGFSQITLASPALNCSPFDKTLNGLSHAGTSPRPTFAKAPVTSLKSPSGAISSIIGLSVLQFLV